jgi:hypothetical protein
LIFFCLQQSFCYEPMKHLFVLLYFFFWPLCCLFFFNIRILIILWYLQTLLLTIFLFWFSFVYSRVFVMFGMNRKQVCNILSVSLEKGLWLEYILTQQFFFLKSHALNSCRCSCISSCT